MRKILFLQIIFFVFYSAFSQQQLSSHKIVTEIQKKYSSVKNISASFVQSRTLRIDHSVQHEQGTIIVTADNKYKIKTEAQTVTTNGTTVWIHSPMSKQVLIGGNTTSGFGFSLNKFLLGLPSDYSVTVSAVQDSFYVLQLNAKTKKTNILMPSTFTVKIGREDFIIYAVEFEDRNKTKTEITLSNISMNRQIPDSLFEFHVPKDAAVVDTRKIK